MVCLPNKASFNDVTDTSFPDCNEGLIWDGYKQGSGNGGFEIEISHPALETNQGIIPEVIYQGKSFIGLSYERPYLVLDPNSIMIS